MRRLAAWLHQCFVSPLIKGAVPLGRIVFKLFNGAAKWIRTVFSQRCKTGALWNEIFTLSADKSSGRLGCFGWILVLVSLLFIALTFPLTLFMCVKVEYIFVVVRYWLGLDQYLMGKYHIYCSRWRNFKPSLDRFVNNFKHISSSLKTFTLAGLQETFLSTRTYGWQPYKAIMLWLIRL